MKVPNQLTDQQYWYQLAMETAQFLTEQGVEPTEKRSGDGSTTEPDQKNITGFAAMDPEKAHEIQKKGAQASADARRGKTADEFVKKW